VLWPPDGLWRITVPSGSSIPISVSALLGIYPQPIPVTGTPTPIQVSMFQVGGITASGNTAIWTPAAGNRFNLLGGLIVLSGNSTRAVASGTSITLRDGGTVDIWGGNVFIPAAAGTTIGNDIILGPFNLNAAYRSSAVNNVLNIRLAAALTAGAAACSVWGFETTG
jgi:hypothetical protein